MNDVGIDAMLHGNPSYGGICSGACRNHLKFEFGTVITPLGGASFARHGVHDVHRAHYLNLSAAIQDVTGQTLTEFQLHPNDIALVSSKVEWLSPLNEALKRSERTQVMFEETSEVDALAARIGRNSPQFQEEIAKIRRRKKCFFMQNSGLIKISTTHSFKGHEAQTVFCILAPEDEAEMVYTGITRAQKNLVVFDSSKSSYRTFFQTHMAPGDTRHVNGT